MAGAALLPGLLGSLFSHGENPKDLRNRALFELDPNRINSNAENMFQQTLNSPGFNYARSQMVSAGQAGVGAINRALAQTGLNRSGVGTAMTGAAAAAPGIQMGQLTASAWDSALNNAMGLARARAGVYGGMPRQEGYGGAFTAAGLNALLPYLFRMLSAQSGNRDMGPGTHADPYQEG
jgi:hypothetical protein